MEKKSGKMNYVLAEALVWMGVLQAALWGMKWLLLPLFPDTRVAYKLFTMGCMLLLTGVVVAYVRYGRRERFSFLPHTWNRRYTLFTGLIDALSRQFQTRVACGRRFAAWPHEPTEHLIPSLQFQYYQSFQ